MIGTGAGALRSIGSLRSPSVSINWSCTIFTTSWPGVTDLITSTPTAWLFTCSVKAVHHVERDVGLEQRAPHLAQRGVDVGLGQRAAPRETVENAAKPIGQAIEHVFKHPEAPARRIFQTTLAPEGASRCRAGTSGLKGRSAKQNSRLC